jgi:hypothetical protein
MRPGLSLQTRPESRHKASRRPSLRPTQRARPEFLQVLLKKATLRGKEWEFEFAQPFDVLFSIGELYFKKREWGE